MEDTPKVSAFICQLHVQLVSLFPPLLAFSRSTGTYGFLMTLLNCLAFFMFPPSSSKAFRSCSSVALVRNLPAPRMLGLVAN